MSGKSSECMEDIKERLISIGETFYLIIKSVFEKYNFRFFGNDKRKISAQWFIYKQGKMKIKYLALNRYLQGNYSKNKLNVDET